MPESEKPPRHHALRAAAASGAVLLTSAALFQAALKTGNQSLAAAADATLYAGAALTVLTMCLIAAATKPSRKAATIAGLAGLSLMATALALRANGVWDPLEFAFTSPVP